MQVIVHDRFDARDWGDALALPPIAEGVEGLAVVDEHAPAALADIFHALLKAVPRLVDRTSLPAEWLLNHRVLTAIMDVPAYRQVRVLTVGDLTQTCVAITAMVPELARLYRAAWRALEVSTAEGDSPGARDEVEALLDRFQPAIDACVDHAVEAAGAGVEGLSVAEMAWSLDSGDLGKLDPADRMELAERLATPRLADITARIGRFRIDAMAADRNRWESAPGEVHEVGRGNDLGRLLPSELLALATPELEGDFLDRWDRKQLAVLTTRRRVPEQRGPAVYVEDSSGTVIQNGRDRWLRALGVAICLLAWQRGRDFRAIVFGGPEQQVEFDLPAGSPIESLIAYAEFTMSGGTAFQPPLTMALAYLDAEHQATGHTRSDVIFATDGEAEVAPDWLAHWRAERSRLGFTCFGIVIGHHRAPTVDKVADHVTTVATITDPTINIDHIFRSVQET